MTLRGIVPILNTPFHPDGLIDFANQERLVEHLLAQGPMALDSSPMPARATR